MNTNHRFRISSTLLVLIFCALSVAMARSEDSGPEAEQILEAAGVKGGLVIHIGCGDGKLTSALGASGKFLVHGLDTDAKNIRKARDYILSLGIYGRVSVAGFDGKRLPYADNLANLAVVEDLGTLEMDEVMRVLCPGGAAYLKQKGKWAKTVKPIPEEIDEWTHYLYDAGGNAVSNDTAVGPPRHFQWISGPRFARSHDHLASVSAMVSSGGRLFYIVDAGSIAFAADSPDWRLVARDAFNGVKLWDRKIPTWEYHLRDFRSGPADIARRLVAVADRVYVTLGYGMPVTALNAATGETVRTYAETEGTQEILYYDDMLLLVLGDLQEDWQAEAAKDLVSKPGYYPPFEHYTPPAHQRRVMAVNANTGNLVWENSQPYTREMMPSTLAAASGQVCFQNTDAVICLDATTGKLQWKAPRPIHRRRLAWSTPTLVVHNDIVFSADRRAEKKDGETLWVPSGGYHDYIRGEDVKGELVAFDGQTGKPLWSCSAYEGFNAPVDVLIADGLLWTGRYAWGNDPGITQGRDPKTGEVCRTRPSDQEVLGRIGHARCHRAKATIEYLILGRRGVEFVDLDTGEMVANFWVRGICQYGVMPANGLLYVPPHSCACSVTDLLKCGFMALAPATKEQSDTRPASTESLREGPAYGFAPAAPSATGNNAWPTYRHDAARSGVAQASVPHNLQLAWETDLGGKLTSPVVAEDLVLVAETGAHRIHALDASTGRKIWTYAAAARIDSPPTIDQGRALFGSADGCVYCLRLKDGTLIWKFRAAPLHRLIVVNEQLESPWPVSGNILVLDGAAYFAAGRNGYLDGGMLLYKLDAATGRKINVAELEIERKKRDGGFASGGYLPDILSTDGDSIFMRSVRFNLDLVRQKGDVAHLWSSVGFLDETWWHRTYWQIGTSMGSGWGGWPKVGQKVPAGRLLVTDGSRVFGYGRNQYHISGAHVGVNADGVWSPTASQENQWTFYRLFGQATETKPDKNSRRKSEKQTASGPDWASRIPMLARAMVLAGETLFVAGPSVKVGNIPHDPTEAGPLADALEAKRGGSLLAVSGDDGKTLADYDIKSPPVFDGMAAADSRLYISCVDGRMICMESAE